MENVLEILKNPNPILRKKSLENNKKNIKAGEFNYLCLEMKETMLASDGIGLAAPQIGKNIRLIVINTKNGAIPIFNPKIIKKSFLKNTGEEGCLSVPFYFGDVKRHNSITYSFLNKEGKEHKAKASGLFARVIQHEVDHLDGILFIDKATNIKRLDEGEVKKAE